MTPSLEKKVANFLGLLGLTILVVGIPLTIKLLSVRQEIRQFAYNTVPAPIDTSAPAPVITPTPLPPPPCSNGDRVCNGTGSVNYCLDGHWYSQAARPGECGKPKEISTSCICPDGVTPCSYDENNKMYSCPTTQASNQETTSPKSMQEEAAALNIEQAKNVNQQNLNISNQDKTSLNQTFSFINSISPIVRAFMIGMSYGGPVGLADLYCQGDSSLICQGLETVLGPIGTANNQAVQEATNTEISAPGKVPGNAAPLPPVVGEAGGEAGIGKTSNCGNTFIVSGLMAMMGICNDLNVKGSVQCGNGLNCTEETWWDRTGKNACSAVWSGEANAAKAGIGIYPSWTCNQQASVGDYTAKYPQATTEQISALEDVITSKIINSVGFKNCVKNGGEFTSCFATVSLTITDQDKNAAARALGIIIPNFTPPTMPIPKK